MDDEELNSLENLFAKNKNRRKRQASKIKQLSELVERKENDVREKLALSMMRDIVVNVNRYDTSTQRPFTDTKFSGEEHLTCFIDDYKDKKK